MMELYHYEVIPDPDYLEKTRVLKLAPVARDFVLSHFLLFNLNFLSLALYSKLQIDMMLSTDVSFSCCHTFMQAL
jgi:hypothetical protein